MLGDRRRHTDRAMGMGDPQSLAVPLLLFFVFLILYGATLLPDVLPADAGEFQLVATTGGVAHPPGYPLYTMVGWLFARIPVGPSAAWRVSLFSAVTAAATLSIVYATARKVTGSVWSGLAAVLALGGSTTFWATATQASIRPLTAFFMALCLYALVHHGAQVRADASQGAEDERDPGQDSYLILFCLALSFGLTHHPSLAFPAVVFLLYLVLVDPALLRQRRRWLKPALALLPGALVFVYLPLRGPPELATVSGFLDHVLARGFRGDMFALDLIDRLVLLPTLVGFQFNRVLLLGMVVGAGLLMALDRRLAFLLIGSVIVHTAVTLTYDAPQTVEYAMPGYVSLALLVAVPCGRMLNGGPNPRGSGGTVSSRRSTASIISFLALVLLSVGGMLNLLAHLPSYTVLSRSRDSRDYVETLLTDAPPNTVILSNWHWFSPLRYLQQVEGRRPDVAVEYVAPRGEPLAQTWVAEIEAYVESRPVIVVRYFEHLYQQLPYTFEPLGEAFLIGGEPRTEEPHDVTRLDVTLGEQIELLGYRLEVGDAEPAQPIAVVLAWSALAPPEVDVALFAQLIGPEGRLWSGARDPRYSAHSVTPGEIIIERVVVYPFLHAPPGEYRLVVGAYSSHGRFTTSDGADTVELATVRLHPSKTRPVTEHPRLIRFRGGPTLIGVDYDVPDEGLSRTYLHWAGPGQFTRLQLAAGGDDVLATATVPALNRGEYATVAVDSPDIPDRLTALSPDGGQRWNLLFRRPVRLPSPRPGARYVAFGDAMVLSGFDDSGLSFARSGELEPGSRTTLLLRFRSQRPLERDFIISAALTGLEADDTGLASHAWSWRASHDTVPALGAIPTLKWIRGSTVLAPHRLIIPLDAASVPVVGSSLVYDHFTQRTLPPLAEYLDSTVTLSSWSPAASP